MVDKKRGQYQIYNAQPASAIAKIHLNNRDRGHSFGSIPRVTLQGVDELDSEV